MECSRVGWCTSTKFKARLTNNLHKSFMRFVDMVFVQENHLSPSRVDSYGSLFSGSWAHFWSPAIDESYNKVGVCIAITQKWSSHVIDYMILVEEECKLLL